MKQVEIDRQAVQRGKARLAVAENRLCAPVWNPPIAGARHAALRHDARASLRAAQPKRTCDQALVVTELVRAAPVRLRGVEHRHARFDGCRDRL